jgi:hypothetical protein
MLLPLTQFLKAPRELLLDHEPSIEDGGRRVAFSRQ